MERYEVRVIEGCIPDGRVSSVIEPLLNTAEELKDVARELMAREPLFHREEFGITGADFEAMTDTGFWEVGASGSRYSREYVIEVLTERYKNPKHEIWQIEDFLCQKIADDNYLVTYALFQGKRLSRRSTIWRRSEGDWKIFYHQGTLISS